ncbi:hypothetical protein [Paenibacillus protaetiae]|uniref:Uncharacterized protein n=1 Tax=Paenibacillus protaetiae TaxID=2509456 RepID=A0A4P6F243_9BACL|nr:hypothetical protein [Paenibacillus protaetiae]QAY68219.1 hypothetical protein ET464_19410 [Paenibacillus protaetiae]
MDILSFLQSRADNLLPVTIERADNNRIICGTVAFVSGVTTTTTTDTIINSGGSSSTFGNASVGIAYNGRIVIIPIDKINQVY